MMDKTCLASAGLFCLSNLIGAIFLIKFHHHSRKGSSSSDFESFQQFNTEFIQKEWEWRDEHRALETTAGVFNAIAWFVLAIPLWQVAWVQYSSSCCGGSGGAGAGGAGHQQESNNNNNIKNNNSKALGLHMAIALLAVGGAITELASHLMYLGMTSALEWLSKDFTLNNWVSEDDAGNDDSVGWKTLELVHIASRGMLLWIGAMEMLFLAIIFLLLFVSIKTNHHHQQQQQQHYYNKNCLFNMRWVYFGVGLAVLCSLDFAAEILRFVNWRLFSGFTILITFLNRVILFPAWLLWLGRQLPGAIQEVATMSCTAKEMRDETSSSTASSTLEVTNIATEINFT